MEKRSTKNCSYSCFSSFVVQDVLCDFDICSNHLNTWLSCILDQRIAFSRLCVAEALLCKHIQGDHRSASSFIRWLYRQTAGFLSLHSEDFFKKNLWLRGLFIYKSALSELIACFFFFWFGWVFLFYFFHPLSPWTQLSWADASIDVGGKGLEFPHVSNKTAQWCIFFKSYSSDLGRYLLQNMWASKHHVLYASGFELLCVNDNTTACFCQSDCWLSSIS